MMSRKERQAIKL